MDSRRPSPNVINLASYLTRRTQQDLPLFARPLRSESVPSLEDRRLSSRQLEHRARMLAHLNGAPRL